MAVSLISALKAQVKSPVNPVGFEDKYIEVNGIRLHYLDWGSNGKPPFIMLHGINRITHQFDHIAPVFRKDYHVMAIDMRGQGDSGWSPEGAYLVEDYEKALDAFIDKLNLRNLILLGNSTGAREFGRDWLGTAARFSTLTSMSRFRFGMSGLRLPGCPRPSSRRQRGL